MSDPKAEDKIIDHEWLQGDVCWPIVRAEYGWVSPTSPQQIGGSIMPGLNDEDLIAVHGGHVSYALYGHRFVPRSHLFRTLQEAQEACDKKNDERSRLSATSP